MTEDGGRVTARPTVLRDRSTWLTYVQVGLFGYFLLAIGLLAQSYPETAYKILSFVSIGYVTILFTVLPFFLYR